MINVKFGKLIDYIGKIFSYIKSIKNQLFIKKLLKKD